MYLHLDSLHVPLGIVGNGWWVFMRRGLDRVVMSGWVVCGNFASSKNWTRWPIGTWLTSPSLQICQVTSWSHVVPGREHYKCVIDQGWGQDGWILTEFNFFAPLWDVRDESRSIKTQKENEAHIKPSGPHKLGQWNILLYSKYLSIN